MKVFRHSFYIHLYFSHTGTDFNAAVFQYIERVSISYQSGSEVQIECEFKEGIDRASCVLVYREYGNETLVVKEYPQNTVFPVTLTVDGDPENYTFAIFGKSGSDIDKRPILEERVNIPGTTTSTSPTLSTTSGKYCCEHVGIMLTECTSSPTCHR